MLDRIVRPNEAEVLTGFSDVHLRRLEDADVFPKRFKLCPDSGKYGACGWMLSSIQAYLKKRADTVRVAEKVASDDADAADGEKGEDAPASTEAEADRRRPNTLHD